MWAWPVSKGMDFVVPVLILPRITSFTYFLFFALYGRGEVPGVHMYFSLINAFHWHAALFTPADREGGLKCPSKQNQI